MQGTYAVSPFFTQRKAIYASDIITRATNIEFLLEARREYDAVNRIFLALAITPP